MGRVFYTTIHSKVVWELTEEQTDGILRIGTNGKIVVVYNFTELGRVHGTKIEHLPCKDIHGLLLLLRNNCACVWV